MQDSENFIKKYEGLLPEEQDALLELKRSVGLDNSKKILQKIF